MSRPVSRSRRHLLRILRERRTGQGVVEAPTQTLPNRTSDPATPEEEQERLQRLSEERLKVFGYLLPGLLQQLARIPDPRQPRKVKHRLTIVLLYGILMFVFHLASRRQANRGLTTPQLLANLQALVPELTTLPHQSTLYALLEGMAVDQIEQAYLELLRSLIRRKKFRNLLQGNRYLVAVDGTQKYRLEHSDDPRYLRRRVKGTDGAYTTHVVVLEAVLIFGNGMVLPLASEFLENCPQLERIESEQEWKQDCELKAFSRLITRLKAQFPRLPVTLLLDGLYANGPVMALCERCRWRFMIVLKDKSLSTVWEEGTALLRLDTQGEHRLERTWRGRRQLFTWANHLEYTYGSGKGKRTRLVNLVICQECWETVDHQGNPLVKTARHAWLSSEPISRDTVHQHCNLMARKRWLQENTILKEKRQGYQYEHIFAHDFQVMRGYHFLMHIGRMLNEMALHAESLIEQVKAVGMREFIREFYQVMRHRRLDTERLSQAAASPGQLRLSLADDW